MRQSILANATKVNLLGGYKKLVTHIRIIYQKRQTRKQLAKLPDYLLKDVNLNYDDAKREIRKSFSIKR